MIHRRCAIQMLAALTGVLATQPLRAQQGFQRFIPFLTDIPGWTALPPFGAKKEGNGGGMTTASRSYARGDARLEASIASGISAVSEQDTYRINLLGTLHTSTIDGFEVTTTFDVTTPLTSTSIIVMVVVALGPDANLNLLFNNVSESEAMMLAKEFDWRAIRAVVN